jgi:hypothetical protein
LRTLGFQFEAVANKIVHRGGHHSHRFGNELRRHSGIVL